MFEAGARSATKVTSRVCAAIMSPRLGQVASGVLVEGGV